VSLEVPRPPAHGSAGPAGPATAHLDREADPAAFVEVMAGVCAPVTVVTAFSGVRPHGTTVSAFASLSLAPPMVLVALDRGSQLLSCLLGTRRFGVNILASDQAGVAAGFARKGDGKFQGVAWREFAGTPRIEGAAGFLACTVADVVPGGDHVVILGAVELAEGQPSAPLTYHRRTFGTHAALAAPQDGPGVVSAP
jgi:flavin reductase (DIM6/NTAB) family NADH-FMN oxidoreductase RutF